MKNTNKYLFLDGGWIFSYGRLKEVFDRCTSADSRLGWEIIEASSNMILSAWLRQYGLSEQADLIDGLVKDNLDSGAELLNKLKEIVGSGSPVARKPLSRYAKLENVEYQLNNEPNAICDDFIILPESGNYSLNISLKFRVYKAALEKFPLKIKVELLNSEDLKEVIQLLQNDPEYIGLNRNELYEKAKRQTCYEIKLHELNLNVNGENETVVVEGRNVVPASKLRQRYEYKLTILADEKEITVLHACHSYMTFDVNGIPFKMIKVKGGEMGTYFIGETQVTQALWKAVVGCYNEKQIRTSLKPDPSEFKGSNRPVENVRWNDCRKFIDILNDMMSNKLPKGYRFALPTEAQWEYAAKGGEKSKGYQYSGCNKKSELEIYAWYDKNAYYCRSSSANYDHPDYGTHVVKKRKPNELKIYDMSGNVWEWCEDSYPYGSGKVICGGGWVSSASDCRVDISSNSSGYGNDIGFRLALVQQ